MNLDKRGVNKLVFGALFLIIIVLGLYFVSGGTAIGTTTTSYNITAVTMNPNISSTIYGKWLVGNASQKTINFTIGNDSSVTGFTGNITWINITVYGNNFTNANLQINSTGDGNGTNATALFYNLTNSLGGTGPFVGQVPVVAWVSNVSMGLGNGSTATQLTKTRFWFNISTFDTNTTANITFVIDIYNSTGTTGNASGSHIQVNLSMGGIDDQGPQFSQLNFTGTKGDSTNTITQASLNLSPSSQGVNVLSNISDINISVMVTDQFLNLTNVTLIWNVSTASVDGATLNPATVGPRNLTLTNKSSYLSIVDGYTSSAVQFTGTLGKSNFSGNFTNIYFTIVAYDHLYNVESANSTTAGIYTTNIRAFNVTVDATAPEVTLTAPSDTSIGVQESITYTCSASDDIGGIEAGTYKIQITRPDSTIVEKTSSSATFSGIDTGQAGTYQIVCKVKNYAGMEGTSTSKSFTTSESSSGSSGGSTTSTGASSTSVTSVQESDLTVDTLTTINSVVEQAVNDITKVAVIATGSSNHVVSESNGVAIAFQSLQGLNKDTVLQAVHTLYVEKVTANSAMIIIKSDPLKTTLNVGQIKEFDINRDNLADIKVTLNSVQGTDADFTITRLAGADALAVTEGGVVTPPVTEPETQGKTSSVIIWIVILVIILLIVWVLIAKKRK